MFLDTSGLLCYQHEDERWHKDARTLFEAAGRKLTHGYILAEFVVLAATRGLPRGPALGFVNGLLRFREVEVVWVTEAMHQEGMRLLAARLDKDYSLCDAISFVLMRQRGVTDALTTDRHFEQEGFRRLLK